MKRKLTHLMLLSLLLSGVAIGVGNYDLTAAISGVKQQVQPKAKGTPGAPTNVTFSQSTPADDGSAEVSVSFTAPTTYYSDWYEYDGLDELTSIVVMERNSNWDYDVVATIDNPEIGAEYTVVLGTLSSGRHSFRIVALNSESDADYSYNYDSMAYASVYVGYDTPGEVGEIVVENNYPSITLSWTPPTKGSNNGYFDASEVTYTVVRYLGWDNSTVVAEGLTETTFTDVLELTALAQVYYQVYAVNAQGNGDTISTPEMTVGPAASLPFNETFADGSASNLWTAASSGYYLNFSNYISQWGSGQYTYFGYFENGYDQDYGALLLNATSSPYEDAEATYTSPDITLEGASAPALSFYHYSWVRDDNALKTYVIIEQAGVQTTVKSFSYTEGSTGWSKVIIPLTDFVGADPIKVIFRGELAADQYGFAAFDCISVDELMTKDLMASDLAVPAKADSGSTINISFNITNNGAQDADDYVINIYKDGELFDTLHGEAALPSGESVTVNRSYVVDNSYSESTSFRAEVVLDGDERLSNNSTDDAAIAVRLAVIPAVDDLTATYQSPLKVNLAWSAPDYVLPESEDVTEGFEGAEHGSDQIDGWAIPEDNTHYPLYIEYKGVQYEAWQDERMSYRVIDQTKLVVTDTTKWFGKAHSGDKYLFSCAALWGSREDWIISPELSGEEQTLEFYAASNTFPTNKWEDIEDYRDRIFVYVSFTDNDPESFTFKALYADGDRTQGYEIQNALANGDDYQKISVDLPEGAKYFALVVVTPDSGDSIVFFDDFSFSQKQAGIIVSLLGYNVYDGETLLNQEPIAETAYVDTVEDQTSHSYSVVAVYNVGSAERSNVAEITINDPTSGVANLADLRGAKVSTVAGHILVTAPAAAKTVVSDFAGRVIARNAGSANIAVAPGNYIVKVGTQVFKVNVK